MKKLSIILLTFAILFTACGKEDTKNDINPSTEEITTEEVTTEEVTTEEITTEEITTEEITTEEVTTEEITTGEVTTEEVTTEEVTTEEVTTEEVTERPTEKATEKAPEENTEADIDLYEESKSLTTANMAYYNEVLTLVNEIRAEAGVAPLTLDTTLCQAATMRSLEMDYSNLFSHTRPDGSSCFTVFGIYNISYWTCGENIAAGYRSPAQVVEGWKNSEGHYTNMINAEFTKLGVGMSNKGIGSYGIYWTQLFAG